MPAVSNALVIGAGAAGSAAATVLAQGGVSVDLVDAKPAVTALGSGITVQGNALRVLRQLGLYDQVLESGYAFNTLGLRLPDEAGTLVNEMEDVRSGGMDLPATVGMYRPDLAQILIDGATAAGAKLRLRTSATGLAQDADGVGVEFSDGSTRRYDLVVGADGIRSWTRRAIGIDVEPAPVGMGIWRVFAKRPDSVTRTDLIFGGRCYIAGYCPISQDALYAYLVEDYQDRSALSAEEGLAVMRELAGGYHGPWDEIRANMTDPSRVNYTSFDSHLVPSPWNRGRVVLIGDAAHSCPPNLVQGAAQALEDAAVLAELVLARADLEGVWPDFMARRYDRVKIVVDSCLQLCEWLLAGERGDVPAVMGRVFSLIALPA